MPTLPNVETVPLNTKSHYVVSNAAGENYLSIYQLLYGVETIGFRYFNVFGPKRDPNPQYTAVIPKFFDQYLSNQNLAINGTGEQTRDFTCIDNMIQFNLKAMTVPSTATGKLYNVGCKQNVSVNELAQKNKALCNSDTEFTSNDSRAGNV